MRVSTGTHDGVMPEHVARFAADCTRLWQAGDLPGMKLGLAVSGGPDSLALLLLAHAARPGSIEAATVDHGLRAGSAGEAEAVARLCERLGVPPHRVLLGHPGRLPDPALHREIARRGAWLVFDGPCREHREQRDSDARLTECLASLVEHGHAERVMLGSGTTAVESRGAPGMHHLPAVLRPRLARELGPEAAERMFVRNPARALAAEWKE